MLRRLSFMLVAAALGVAGAVASFGTPQARGLPVVPSGFNLAVVAQLNGPREIVAAPDGDLLVGTLGNDVYVVPHAEGEVGKPAVFVHVADAPDAGVALGDGALYIGGQFGVWRVPYEAGDTKARQPAIRIAAVRPGGTGSHSTTSVAFAGERLYASVGSSCNACDPERDGTRASVQQMKPDGSGMHAKAVHIRNAVALAVNEATGSVWAGVAGQDELAHGHPYEIFDPITAHAGTVDYGWPHCYENHRPVESGHDCAQQTAPRVVFPAYDTPVGAAFYPANPRGRYAFPAAYAGGAFVALHGSWHAPPVPPRVAFVPLAGDQPKAPVDWGDPNTQWQEFVGGFQRANGYRIGRPTGVAVGPQGSLFIADDKSGAIYRIRPR